MKVITLTQPWASLMAFDEKRFETRGWKTPHRGPLAIHAAKRFPRECRDLCDESPFSAALVNIARRQLGLPLLRDGATDQEIADAAALPAGAMKLPIGQIIAVVDLVAIVATDTMSDIAGGTIAACKQPWHGVHPGRSEWSFGDYAFGRYAWVTRNVRRLSKPIEARGALSLWEYDTDAIEAALLGEDS